MDADLLSNSELYINRELSLLEFVKRVLAQTSDETVPLLERLRFLGITSSILDEFFEIRVAGLKQQEAYGAMQRGADNMSPGEQLRRIAPIVQKLVEKQYRILNEEMLPALEAQGIRFVDHKKWTHGQKTWLKRYFKRELAPIISPVALDPAHPFPEPLNKSLSFIVILEGKDAFGRNSGKAIVQAPRALPRLIRLPEECAEGPNDFVLLTTVIEAHVSNLFPGMQALGCFQFRVTRNSDLFIDPEEVDDLLRALEGELSSRRYGDAVRLEVAMDCPEDIQAFLAAQFRVRPFEVYHCAGPVNLMHLATIPDRVDRPDLKYPGFTPAISRRLRTAPDLFEAIRADDILLHHPFDSFAPFIEFLRQAANDPAVVSIRQTLYRTGPDSAVVEMLTRAANAGKEVMVVIELRARFDEAANIELANHLQEAGAQVVYGVVGYKTHAKMCLVIRREGDTLRRYAHLGTGNYHARTARLYTDYGLFTCEGQMCEDVQNVFQQLTAMGRAGRLNKILQSPFTLHKSTLEFIERETANAKAGKPAKIMVKMNSLLEPQLIQTLYRASQAGVQIDLIIRGICALRPGLKGVSENIRVRSIVGRFLEHTRVLYFHNDDDPQVYLSSADWMDRNFFKRIEACFPVEKPDLKARLINEAFTTYLEDNAQAWELKSDGSYVRVQADGEERVVAQETLLRALTGS
ncbi:MAG: polyphosphate kinase 1 [Proteobacteria bacterium]|nr:polyphosphate kinase 1 [Pseudomonadota bacterium]